jgi:hypothetical protein
MIYLVFMTSPAACGLSGEISTQASKRGEQSNPYEITTSDMKE